MKQHSTQHAAAAARVPRFLPLPAQRGRHSRGPAGWLLIGGAAFAAILVLSACGGGSSSQEEATRTPIPTWTPTQASAAPPPAPGQQPPGPQPPAQGPAPAAGIGTPAVNPTEVAEAIATATPTIPPTDTPTATPVPTNTPLPTDTPTVTPPPTDTPTAAPSPTPTQPPAYAFTLEAAEKFPTDSLAPNVVRIYAYVYNSSELGLPGYKLSVIHNGTPLVVKDATQAGVPATTRDGESPYKRFTNFSTIFVEPQAGEWRLQLVDPSGVQVGPEAIFNLTADETTRELYVRYLQK